MATTSLVIVAGHATLGTIPVEPWEEEGWILQSFQAGEVPFYREHCLHGVVQAVHNPEAILVFSGGRTREDSLNSEAGSYCFASQASGWWLPPDHDAKSLTGRIWKEEFARDSFENVLFSILRFHQATNDWPERVTVVGWKFKAPRFELHRQALRIPNDCWEYEEVNQPFDLVGAGKGEAKALEAFQANPYGCWGDLRDKRETRNPHGDPNPYSNLPEVSDFLAFMEAREHGEYPRDFPWE